MGSSAFAFENPKTRVMAGSPQSTLCSFGGRSRASSNGPSLVSSPPSPLESKNDDAWDLLYEAAGQVVRLRMNEESAMVNQQVHCRGLLGPPRNPSPPPPPPPPPAKTANLGLHLDQAFARRQLQAQQFHQLKKQQLLKQQQSLNAWGRQQGKVTPPAAQQMLTRPRGGGCGGYAGGRGGGLSSSAWPPLNSPRLHRSSPVRACEPSF
ncbi:hypothetical protein QJS10_CPA07g00087 [Acorus calamus]|uniref:Uncharacterized protein n=1 Tax=Acorus calamus TaxID=4465 RepID=A0AAV9EF38_ACOCL|nr:hypothetical protein QJS10_CPA07g00087 [Acorus calamus]